MENKIQYVILGLLLDRKMNGYTLKQTMEISTSNFIKPSYGNIYPTLKKLKKRGDIDDFVDDSTHKKTIIYHVTDQGYARFKRWLLNPVEDPTFGHNHLLHLFFYRHLSRQEQTRKTNALISFYRSEIKKLSDLRNTVEGLADAYQKATIDYGIQCYELIISFYQNKILDQNDGPKTDHAKGKNHE